MFEKQINQLIKLKNSKKFSESEWIKRGLNPSHQEIIDEMENNVDNCLSELIGNLQNNKSKSSLKAILKSNLKKIGKNLDTEEREFIADIYSKISTSIDIDLSQDLNRFLYGSLFTIIKSISDVIRGKEKIIEIIENNCTNCGVKLETFILEKMDSSIQNNYDIVRCNNCFELNLIDNGNGNKRIQFGDYELIEQLSKNTYNFDDANIRLKQIKTFRK